MKNQKKIPISAERVARLAQLRKRFLRGGLLSVAGILVFVFSLIAERMRIADLPLNWFNGVVFMLLFLACVCFSGYALCGGDRGTRFESVVIVMLILVISAFFTYIWYILTLY